MVDSSKKYYVDIKVLKKDAKLIKKQNSKHEITEKSILHMLVSFLRFDSFSEYKNYPNDPNFFMSSLSDLMFHEVYEMKKEILNKFRSIGVNVEGVSFIDNILALKSQEMKLCDDFFMSTYIYCLPYLLNLNDLKCIDLNNAEIHRENLRFLLNVAMSRYNEFYKFDELRFHYMHVQSNAKNLFDIHDYLKITKNHYSGSKGFLYLKDGRREMYFAIKNDYDGCRHKEGLVFEKMKDVHNGLITMDNLIDFIVQEIEEELIFKNKFNHHFDSEKINRRLHMPRFEKYVANKQTLNEISEMANNILNCKPLLLGKREKKGLFKKTEYLRISKEDMNDNILISGSAGSGAITMAFSFVAQILKEGRGFIYADFLGWEATSSYLYSIAKILNRENDIVFLSVNHEQELLSLDIDKLVLNNKILIISSPCVSKLPMKEQECIIKKFNNLLSKIKSKPLIKSNYNYPIFINDLYDKDSAEFNKLKKQIVRLNEMDMCCIYTAQGLDFLQKESDISNTFKNIILMKSEFPFVMDALHLNDVNFNDIKILCPGEFYFVKDGEIKYDYKFRNFFISPFFKEPAFMKYNGHI